MELQAVTRSRWRKSGTPSCLHGKLRCVTQVGYTAPFRHFPPPNAGIAYGEASEMPDNYPILMSHFTRKQIVDPQDICTYPGVGIDYEELC